MYTRDMLYTRSYISILYQYLQMSISINTVVIYCITKDVYNFSSGFKSLDIDIDVAKPFDN